MFADTLASEKVVSLISPFLPPPNSCWDINLGTSTDCLFGRWPQEAKTESEESLKSYVNKWVTAVGNWGSILSPLAGDSMTNCRTYVRVAPLRWHESGLFPTKFCPWLVADWFCGVNTLVFKIYGTEWLENPSGRETQEDIGMHWNAKVTPENMDRELVIVCHVVQEQHYLAGLPYFQQLKDVYSFSLVLTNEPCSCFA